MQEINYYNNYHTKYFDTLKTNGFDAFCDFHFLKTIFYHLSIESLTRMGSVSKRWKEVTDLAPFWKIICIRGLITPKSKPHLFSALAQHQTRPLASFISHISKDAAIQYLTTVLSSKSLPKSFKFEAENWLKLVTALKMLRAPHPDFNPIAQLALILCNLSEVNPLVNMQARKIAATLFLQGHSTIGYELSKVISHPNEHDDAVVLRAQSLIAKQHIEREICFLKDAEVSILIKKIMENKEASETCILQAEYMKALLVCQNRDPNPSYNEAAKTFQKFIECGKLSQHVRIHAEYQLALMQAKGFVYISNLNPVAHTLFSAVHNEHCCLATQAEAQFYLATMTLKNFTSLLTTHEAIQLMKKALHNEFLPKDLFEEAQHILNQMNGLSEIELAPESKKMLLINGRNYAPISRKTTQFSGHAIAFLGTSREILIHDPEVSLLASVHFQNVLKLISFEKVTEEQILLLVLRYIRREIFKDKTTDISTKVKAFITSKTLDTYPVISIDAFIAKGLGIGCHHSLVTAYILDGLTKEVSKRTKRPYLTGVVQIIREKLPRGGVHTWVTIANQTFKMHIDTFWNKIVDFSTVNGIKALEEKYGVEPIKSQLLKVEKALMFIEPIII